MNKAALFLLCTFGIFSAGASAQSTPEMHSGTKEIEFFVAGGHSVAGGRSNTGVFQAGARFGCVLFRAPVGNLEYSIDFIPIYFIAQVQNAYGVSFTPFNLKYNFTAFRGAVPYLELGGGVLFTNHDVPDGTNAVNFTPQTGLGVQLPLRRRSNDYFGVALKYVHISNAGLATPNPGLNTLQIKLSVGRYTRR